MPFLLALAVCVPLIGGGATLVLSRPVRTRRFAHWLALAAAVIAVALVIALYIGRPGRWMASRWYPITLFGTSLLLQPDPATTLLGLGLALAVLCALVLQTSNLGETPVSLLAATTGLLASGLAALWSANVLTLLVGWGIFDLCHAYARLAAGGKGPAVARAYALNATASLALWMGAALSHNGHALTQPWPSIRPEEPLMWFWAGAGVIRLSLYPLHFSAPEREIAPEQPVTAALLLQPLLGWGLWLRIAQASAGSMPIGNGLMRGALVAMALSSVLAWTQRRAERSLRWIGLGAAAAILAAASAAGQHAAALLALGGFGWALGTFLLVTYSGWRAVEWWRNIPAVLGAATLLGVPLTPLFRTASYLLGTLVLPGRTGPLVAYFLGQIFLTGALLRWLRTPRQQETPSSVNGLAVWASGAALPAAATLVAGLFPGGLLRSSEEALGVARALAQPTIAGWLVWSAALVLGGLLAWQDRNLRSRVNPLFGLLNDLLRLEWLLQIALGAIARGLGIVRLADEVVGGAGALLWSCVLLLAILLLARG